MSEMPEAGRTRFVRDFLGMLYEPSATMVRILDRDRDPWAVPLVLLMIVSSAFKEISVEDLRELDQVGHPALALLAGVGIFIVVAVVLTVLFVALCGIATVAGRYLLGGEGGFRRVLSAMAWGLVPAIVAMVYRIPAAFLRAASERVAVRGLGEGAVIWDRGVLSGESWIFALVMALLEIGVFLWMVVVTSRTLGIAHRFTAWHGLACLVLTWLSPLVLVLAAFLTLLST